jgi:hypothetical protein
LKGQVGLLHEYVRPQGFDQLFSSDHDPVILDEQQKQIECLGLERNDFITASQQTPGFVQPEGPEFI